MSLPRDTTYDAESTKDIASNTSTPDTNVRPAQDFGHRPTKFQHILSRQHSEPPDSSAKYDCFPREKSHHESAKSPSEPPMAYIPSNDGPRPYGSVSSEDTLHPPKKSDTVDPPKKNDTDDPPYHVFSKKRKWAIFLIIGVAGMFSGLSSNIYFPAMNTIAQDLEVSLNMVSLTITSYLIIQGISPLLWGSVSDVLGRRPIYIASFAVYIVSNIALSFSPSFGVLLVFRGLQAGGSAATVSIGTGVIQDLFPPSERGGFVGHYQSFRMVSLAAGPVLGGLLSNYLGFRSIFIFLLITSTITLAVIVFSLPETFPSIAGDGTIPQHGIHKPLVQYITGESKYSQPSHESSKPKRRRVTPSVFLEPMRLLAQMDVTICLFFGGVTYSVWSMVTSSTTGLFKTTFGFSDLQIGLCFIPNGLGTMAGGWIAGKLTDKDFKVLTAEYLSARNMHPETKLSSKDIPADFPIERARLKHFPWIVSIFIVSTATYGFSLASPSMTSLPGWWAVPLVLQFFIAASSNAVFALNSTLVLDLCPGKGATGTAISNLLRCGLGAVGVAFVEQLIAAAGVALAFVSLALITLTTTPLAMVHWQYGQRLRAQRMAAEEENGREDTEARN